MPPSEEQMREHLRKYEDLFILTPQRMRIIVDVLGETLEKGLKEPGQVVVSII